MIPETPNEQIAWTYYKSVEDDFIDYLDYVPLTNGHKGVWSPKLANLLLNICSIIDSTFKYCFKGPAINSANYIEEIRTKDKKDKRLSINDFQKVYNDVYKFSDRDVYFLSTEEKLTPWSNWQKQKYLFSWDNVPGNDGERLRRFLRDDLDIGWVENAEIRKPDDGKTIRISEDENSAEIMIKEKKEKATLKVRDGITLDLKLKKENGKLNIFKQSSPPFWWSEHNKIKHNRFENKAKATLENTLYALSGLFLVCVLLIEFRPNLIDREIIKGGSFDKDYLKSVMMHHEPIVEVEPIIAESKLFKYSFVISGPEFRGGNRSDMK